MPRHICIASQALVKTKCIVTKFDILPTHIPENTHNKSCH